MLGRMNGALFGIKEALAFAFNFPEIPGVGTHVAAGAEPPEPHRAATSASSRSWRSSSCRTPTSSPSCGASRRFIRTNVPQVYLDVDREAAQARGVGPAALFSTLQAMLSTLYINDFNMYGRTYRVQLEAQSQFRQRARGHRPALRAQQHGRHGPVGARWSAPRCAPARAS